jgi:hypothetical protein
MADLGDPTGLLREAQQLLASPGFAEEALDPELRTKRAQGLALVAIGVRLEYINHELQRIADRP